MRNEIKSLYGRWKGNALNGFTEKIIWSGIKIYVNETEKRVVYSNPFEYTAGMWTDEIVADPGEAICFIHHGDKYSRVVVGRVRIIVNWAGYYFYSPELSPILNVRNGSITVSGIPVTLNVIRGYSKRTKEALRHRLCSMSPMSVAKIMMIESLLS